MFGNTQQQQPPTSGGLFGNTQNTNQGSNPGGNLFGNQNQQQQQQPAAGTSLFGSTNTTTQPASGGFFGSTNTTGQQPAGGLFGGPPTQPGTTFGSVTGSLFGKPASNQNGGLFGNTSNQQNPAGNLFGGPNQQQQQPQQQPPQQQSLNAGGSLFGSTSNTGASGSTGSGLFGGPTTTSSNQGGGLFGSSTNTGGGGLFGNTTNTSAPTPSGGLFGSTQPSTSNPLFGGQSNTQQGPSLFGQTQPQQGSSLGAGGNQFTSGSLFGNPSSTGVLRSTLGPQQSGTDPQSQYNALLQRIDAIKQAWDPNSPNCKFQHYFYNLVDPSQIRMYGRPLNSTNEALWQKAVRENPDSSCRVPVLALGFDDIQKRVDAQTNQATSQQATLQELKKRIEALSQRHELSNVSRLHRASALQTQLTQRLLRLVQHLHLLIPALRSSSIRPEEEALRATLEEIDEEIRRPGGMGRIRGKLNELWALVGAISAARERDRKGGADGSVEWAVVDEDGLGQIAQILAEQQAGLSHLTKILQKDLNDLAVIRGTAGQEDSEMA